MLEQQGIVADQSTQIAESDASPLRVLSGPGTGKTYALKKKVARLLKGGVNPKEILATTFTRTAAEDLKNALEDMEIESASSVDSTTVHSLCFRILNQEGVLQSTGRVPRPLLDYEKRFLLEDLKHANLGDIGDLNRLLKAFAAAWARDQYDEAGWASTDIERSFEAQLINWLKFHKAMLIEELVPEALRYLRNNPACNERKAYSHVLVDEYQDLNVSEQEFISLISDDAKLAVIGDENQSIYSFKHAHPEGIVEFKERHPETTDIPLNVCWRCPENIVTLANSLISHNSPKTLPSLQAHPDNAPAKIHIVQWASMDSEAQGIAKLARALIANGDIEAGNVLVLAPTRQIGYAIRDALRSDEILAHSFFREEALEGRPQDIRNSRAQQAFTLLTLLADPEDIVALRCWCGFGSNDLRAGAWERLRKLCDNNECSMLEGMERILDERLSLSYGTHLIERLEQLRECLSKLSSLQGKDLIDTLFPEGNVDFLQIREALNDDIEDDAVASTILERLRLSITQPELPKDVDYVRIMSLYKSKGLTADLVIVAGCIQGLIPRMADGELAENSEKHHEEQRRLFYVAITRSRKYLILSSVKSIPTHLAHRMGVAFQSSRGGNANTRTSEFIHELGPTQPRLTTGEQLLNCILGSRSS